MRHTNIRPITILLDRSGSMEQIRNQTIDGVNAFLRAQALDTVPSCVTMILFDSQNPCEVVVTRCPVAEVLPLDRDTFVPRSNTPLYDAIARAVAIAETDPGADPIFVIVTDGAENASREVTGQQVRRIIEDKEAQGWRFVYLGANQDAVREAGRVGVRASRSMTYRTKDDQIDRAYSAASRIVSDLKCGMDAEFRDDERKEQESA